VVIVENTTKLMTQTFFKVFVK